MANVLIIDDSETERQYLSKILLAEGHNIEFAHNAEDGIERVRELKPDLVLMDVMMPKMNGFQATRILTKDAATSKIPNIVVSTKDQETDRIWAHRQGACDYLVKPVPKADLLNAVRRHLK
jgi:twitching motility two-component system response regulator PilH